MGKQNAQGVAAIAGLPILVSFVSKAAERDKKSTARTKTAEHKKRGRRLETASNAIITVVKYRPRPDARRQSTLIAYSKFNDCASGEKEEEEFIEQ